MYKPYNNEKLNGTPRMVETRVFRVDQGSGEETAISNIPVFVNNGPHRSDRNYTPFGALESEVYHDVLSDSIVIYECGEYQAAFDEHHHLTHEEYHYEGCSGKNEDFECTFENKYDDEGQLVRQSEWSKRDGRGNMIVAEFGDRGLMSRKTSYYYRKLTDSYIMSSVETFAYDKDGKLTQSTVVDESGKVMTEETREYNGNGILAKKTIRHHRWGETMRFTYRKDINYFITIQTSYCEKKINYRSSKLNDHGNVVAAHLHNVESSLDYDDGLWKTERRDIIRRNEYVYDAHGNWTRQDFYLEDGHYYVTRKIEYYD